MARLGTYTTTRQRTNQRWAYGRGTSSVRRTSTYWRIGCCSKTTANSNQHCSNSSLRKRHRWSAENIMPVSNTRINGTFKPLRNGIAVKEMEFGEQKTAS